MHYAGRKRVQVQLHGVGPGFFSLFGIARHQGRGFTARRHRRQRAVAVVSQDLADGYYGGHALGQDRSGSKC